MKSELDITMSFSNTGYLVGRRASAVQSRSGRLNLLVAKKTAACRVQRRMNLLWSRIRSNANLNALRSEENATLFKLYGWSTSLTVFELNRKHHSMSNNKIQHQVVEVFGTNDTIQCSTSNSTMRSMFCSSLLSK